MVFSSLTFLALFLPVFLVGFCVLADTPWRFPFLLAVSLWFYAWGEPVMVVVMLVSIAVNYTAGRLLDQPPGMLRKGAILTAAIAFNLILLIGFKYTHFLVTAVAPVLAWPSSWAQATARIPLPLGISFVTFHGLSYVVDVGKGRIKGEQSLVRFAAYISMFPHLIAGPIVRYADIREELDHPVRIGPGAIWSGLGTFVFGLMAKVLLANPCGAVADAIFSVRPDELTTSAAWLGASAYFFQIFFDFSGYSTMAIGLGRCCGFTFPKNFDQPYRSSSITEFWRRWHMTLSRFFRDYVYIPMGGNRRGSARTALNLLAVFFLCGLWHGAAWTFVIWGAYHGTFLVLERLLRQRGIEPQGWPGTLYATVVVMIGWVFFRSDGYSQAVRYLRTMAGFGRGWRQVPEFASPGTLALLLVAATVAYWPANSPSYVRSPNWVRTTALTVGGLASAWFLIIGTHNPFIYYRF